MEWREERRGCGCEPVGTDEVPPAGVGEVARPRRVELPRRRLAAAPHPLCFVGGVAVHWRGRNGREGEGTGAEERVVQSVRQRFSLIWRLLLVLFPLLSPSRDDALATLVRRLQSGLFCCWHDFQP